MENKQFTEKESLALITEMISRTKRRYIGDGNIMLMWGYLSVAVAALVWVLLSATRHPAWNFLFNLIWVIGCPTTVVMHRHQVVRHGESKSYSDRVTTRIWAVVSWSAVVMTVFCLGFFILGGVNTWSMMLLYAFMLVPFGEIAQGIVIKEKTFVIGGSLGLLVGFVTGCCLVGGIPLYAFWYMPVFMLAFVCMFVIPGHVLNHKARMQR